MMVCGKYFLNVQWPNHDSNQQHQSSKKFIRLVGSAFDSSQASQRFEEIELKCHALFEADSASVQHLSLIGGSKLTIKRCETTKNETRRCKGAIGAPIELMNPTSELLKEAAKLSDSNGMLLSIASVEIGQDALSLIKSFGSSEPDYLSGFGGNNKLVCCKSERKHQQRQQAEYVVNESHESGKLSILGLSLVDQENINESGSSSTKCSIREEEEEEEEDEEGKEPLLDFGRLRALKAELHFGKSLDNKTHVNITTTKSEIVTAFEKQPNSREEKDSCSSLVTSEQTTFREEYNKQQQQRQQYQDRKHKTKQLCRECSTRKTNKSLKAPPRRHFGHWLMAWSLKQARVSSIFSRQAHFNKQTTSFMIMISYCHKEAGQHALSLKKGLERIGLSVYLDVDEICKGCDWQDSLNEAICNCYAFVPLVTPSYGETLWTRREFKLADALDKHIIPVNFCTSWPPSKLAIQFATVQYISWLDTDYFDGNDDDDDDDESEESMSEGSSRSPLQVAGNQHWPKACLRSVTHQIKQSISQRLACLATNPEIPLGGKESLMASLSSESADSMFNSSSSPETEQSYCSNKGPNFHQFNKFRPITKVFNENRADNQQTEVEREHRESEQRKTPPMIEFNEESRQAQMQISCRSFSLLPEATNQIETPPPPPSRTEKGGKEAAETTTTTAASALTMARKKSFRFRAVKTFNKVRRRLNGHQEVTRS